MFRPMLAAKVDDPKILTFPLIASPKFDGVRAVVINGTVLSRNLKPIPNEWVQSLFGHAGNAGLDGELIVGSPTDPKVFNTTTSAVMSRGGIPDVKFYVFDDFTESAEYWDRYARMSVGKDVIKVMQKWCHNLTDVLDFERFCLQQGYEGIILRHPKAPYKYGRSTLREAYLLKLKRFADSEAVVLDCEELMHNANEATVNELGLTERSSHKVNQVPTGTLGALLVRDVFYGWEFKIGTGFTDSQRLNFWKGRDSLVGRIAKYTYQTAGMKDLPRFPSFKGFRSIEDMS